MVLVLMIQPTESHAPVLVKNEKLAPKINPLTLPLYTILFYIYNVVSGTVRNMLFPGMHTTVSLTSLAKSIVYVNVHSSANHTIKQ